MDKSLIRKYSKRRSALNALLAKNPVLVMGLDLPFVIACGTTLRNAVAMSLEMFLIHMATMIVAMITARHLPLWSRMLVNVGASFVVMTFARSLITGLFPDLANYVGMYVYLMAVNGITIYQCTQVTRRDKPWPVLSSAFMNALAFALTMAIVSLLREFFALGTLWGIPMGVSFRLTGLAMPFSGFLIMGFLLAFAKWMNKLLTAYSISEAIRRDAQYMDIGPVNK